MTDITPLFNELLETHGATRTSGKQDGQPQLNTVDEFLKEAFRINAHISSLLKYLKSIRQSYLSTAPPPPPSRRRAHLRAQSSSSSSPSSSSLPDPLATKHLTDQERDSIDSSTALLLRDLSSSIANLASAETLRQETQASLLRRKYGARLNSRLWSWAAGGGGGGVPPRSAEQEEAEDSETTIKTVRENVLWFLRRNLEEAAEAQRGMVEKRIERAREKEKSVLYKSSAAAAAAGGGTGVGMGRERGYSVHDERGTMVPVGAGPGPVRDTSMDQETVAEIEAQLSPEQLQLFAQENDNMLKHYEDTLSKVQNAEKSLLEIASLQQTLVTHLATQEDFINRLVTDALSTHTNVTQGNKELKRASERRSTAQMVFWATVFLCLWLIIWDAIF
ncbi:hypothetical protein VTO42DRAFT_8517 [Malbranchea cinnamomea]